MEYAEYLGGKCMYSVSDYTFQFKIFLNGEKNNPVYTLSVFVGEAIMAIFPFELREKNTEWFFSKCKIFPPDKPGQKTEEWLSNKKEVAQIVFLAKITKNCWEIISQLSSKELFSKKELRTILRRNLPNF